MPQARNILKFGRYDVTGRIAIGGMATVYRARLRGAGGFDREFALKVIHSHLTQAEGFLDRFYDEARVASRINHPNVVATVDIEAASGRSFLVLELINGVTLRQLQLTRELSFPGPEAARVIADAARGLHAVHTVADESGESLDAIHRDISPHNLMVDASGRTILIDLGLVKARGQLGHTQTGVLAGKLPYMSPEQSLLLPLDARSDVFSLGSVLFELVVGELPFGNDHSPDTLSRLRSCDRASLAQRLEGAHVDPWLSAVILACLHADPNDRFPTALALAEALEDEMRNNSVRDTEIRRWLATHSKVAKEQLGGDSAVDPREFGTPVAARGRGAMIAAAAILASATAAFFAVSAWQRGSVEPSNARGSLAPDAEILIGETPRPATELPPPRQTPPTQPNSEHDAEVESETGEEDSADLGDADSTPKRRRARRPKPVAEPVLKENPYTD
jgi:serine/threonine-protein kinase